MNTIAPVLAVGDGVLGFWKALAGMAGGNGSASACLPYGRESGHGCEREVTHLKWCNEVLVLARQNHGLVTPVFARVVHQVLLAAPTAHIQQRVRRREQYLVVHQTWVAVGELAHR